MKIRIFAWYSLLSTYIPSNLKIEKRKVGMLNPNYISTFYTGISPRQKAECGIIAFQWNLKEMK